MSEIIHQLKIFLESKQRIAWIKDDSMSVYVRKGTRYLNKHLSKTLDIASVEVEENKRNQGVWTEFLKEAHKINPYQATFIENVLNPVLEKSLVKNGWKVVDATLTPPSFWMQKESFSETKFTT